MITFTAVDFFQVLDLENYDLDIFNLANTEGIDMESIGGYHLHQCRVQEFFFFLGGGGGKDALNIN